MNIEQFAGRWFFAWQTPNGWTSRPAEGRVQDDVLTLTSDTLTVNLHEESGALVGDFTTGGAQPTSGTVEFSIISPDQLRGYPSSFASRQEWQFRRTPPPRPSLPPPPP